MVYGMRFGYLTLQHMKNTDKTMKTQTAGTYYTHLSTVLVVDPFFGTSFCERHVSCPLYPYGILRAKLRYHNTSLNQLVFYYDFVVTRACNIKTLRRTKNTYSPYFVVIVLCTLSLKLLRVLL